MNNGRTHWEGCHEHHLECALAKLAECERDAKRYRVLREARLVKGRGQFSMVLIWGIEHAFNRLDAAIDAAMLEE